MYPKEIMATEQIGKLVLETTKSITSYLESKEKQKTERERIRACLTAITKKCKNDRLKFENYLEKSYKEREILYEKAEKLMDHSIHNNDLEFAKLSVEMILIVYKKNPLEEVEKISGDQTSLTGFLK